MTNTYLQYLESVRYNIERPTYQELDQGTRHQMLYDLYLADGFYTLNEGLNSNGDKVSIRPLRNPLKQIATFYAATLWPRSDPVFKGDESLYPEVQKVWTRSNWSQEKQKVARLWPIFGDLFLKIEKPDPQKDAYITWLDPRHVIDFDVNPQGILTYLRIGYTFLERNTKTGKTEEKRYIEVWVKGNVRTWVLDKNKQLNQPLDTYGTPRTNTNTEFDFIPTVHMPFEAGADKWGLSCITGCLDKIHEADKHATLAGSRMYRYNKPVMALETDGYDKTGRPLPPPVISKDQDIEPDSIRLDGETFYRLPGGTSIKYLVPPLDYNSALALLKNHIEELDKTLPELQYVQLAAQSGENSAIALRLKLMAAINKAVEVRAKGELAIKRAFDMALTINGVEGYGTPLFEYSFEQPDVIERSEDEAIMLATQLQSLGFSSQESLERVGLFEALEVQRMKPF